MFFGFEQGLQLGFDFFEFGFTLLTFVKKIRKTVFDPNFQARL